MNFKVSFQNFTMNFATKLSIFFAILILSHLSYAKIPSIYGYIEPITLLPNHTVLEAKLDTGAVTASLSAANIHLYKENNKDYVSFNLSHPKVGKIVEYKLPVVRLSTIKKRATIDGSVQINTPRPVVKISVCFASKVYEIDVNLIDRSHFSTPMLLGRKALKKMNIIVNSATQNTVPSCDIYEPKEE
jgi:hypothetical protein